MSSRKRVRYVLIGAGNIAQVAVLPAFSHAKKNSELVGIISGDRAKRSALGKRLDVSVGAYSDLEEILKESRADAVYVATPNSTHRAFTERAADAGAHVLCEKPLAPTVDDCEAMAEACRVAKVKLMCAYRLHFEKTNLEALRIVRSGKIGEPRLFDSFFSHVVRPGDIRTNPDLAGGATYDLGVYCINAARHLFGSEPIWVSASGRAVRGVDDTVCAVLRFGDDRLAQFCVSNSVAGVSAFRVGGDKGDLRLEPAYEYSEGNELHLTVNGKRKQREYSKRDQFAPELLHFSDCILKDREPEPSVEEAIRDVRVVEAILESLRTGRPVDLPRIGKNRSPTIRQETRLPPFSRPKTVNAPSPSLR